MLQLFTQPNAKQERAYIAELIFKHFLGLDYEPHYHDRAEVVVTDESGRRLVLDDSFFSALDGTIVRKDKVPNLPLARWAVAQSGLEVTLAGPELPVLFGKPLSGGQYFKMHENEIRLGIDVLGSAFFMLSRYEELVSDERDEYDRFPAAASIAFKAGFLERPIVNEYVEVFWQCLKRLWSGLARRERFFRVLLSHDVDQPFRERDMSASRVLRTMVGDTLKRKDPVAALKRAGQWGASRFLGPHYDPVYTFDYIMDLAERHGVNSAFYFIPSASAGPPDYRYGIYDSGIEKLMSDIHTRGHEIGYHASIDTYQDRALVQKEVALLRRACENIGCRPAAYGGRQHYLRVRVPVTLRYLAEAGMAYDTTLGYADHAGFRCGTCWEYPFYDLEERRVLPIAERPLIVMECSVCDPSYMGFGTGEHALEFMLRLARLCRQFCGDFTLLWHNTRLTSPEERRLFETLVTGLFKGN
jgi:peptidoglycan/xylan/chitin deacetylase (PgdA/CDA1 family)